MFKKLQKIVKTSFFDFEIFLKKSTFSWLCLPRGEAAFAIYNAVLYKNVI